MATFGDSGFDAQAPENNDAGNVIPAGEYCAVIVKSEKVSCKEPGAGEYLKLDFQIVEGEQQNKHVFENLNVWLAETTDKKKTAVKIAKANLSAICRAVGVLNPKDSSELHGKPLRIKVVVDEGNAQFGKQNRIKDYKPRGFAAPQAAPPQQPVGAGVSSSANPWG